MANCLPNQEPFPLAIGDWGDAIGKRPLNKFIYMAEPSHIDEIRPIVAERIGNLGHLTQAQSNMLEVLPPNASKGNGVRRLLGSLQIAPEHVMAIGDAENVRHAPKAILQRARHNDRKLQRNSDTLFFLSNSEQDLEMLEMVGFSCAVANALPSVKKVAKYTNFSSNVDDGVAEAIEQFFLSKVNVPR